MAITLPSRETKMTYNRTPTKKILEYRAIDPKKLSEEDIKHLQAVSYRGIPLSHVGKSFDLSNYELLRLMRLNPNLKTALAKAEAHIQIAVSEKLIEQINKGNVQAIKWFEQSRFGYSDKQPEMKLVQQEINEFLNYLRKTLSPEAYDEVANATQQYQDD